MLEAMYGYDISGYVIAGVPHWVRWSAAGNKRHQHLASLAARRRYDTRRGRAARSHGCAPSQTGCHQGVAERYCGRSFADRFRLDPHSGPWVVIVVYEGLA